MSKLKVSEIFYSAQGEGRYVGVPSIFLRTFGCNFKCEGFGMSAGQKSTERDLVDATKYKTFEELPLVHTGCDSYASWDPRFKDFSPMLEIPAVITRLFDLCPNNSWRQPNGNDIHLVITGGEPLLGWQRAYPDLLMDPRMIDLNYVTFETNGTQELTDKFAEQIQAWHMEFRPDHVGQFRELQFSVSPKLSVSGERWEDAIRPDIVVSYQDVGVTYLKFVVDKIEDFVEVDTAVNEYRAAGFMGPVYVMPVGGTSNGYNQNRVHVADEAMKRGYYYSPRLHVDLWGNGWGK